MYYKDTKNAPFYDPSDVVIVKHNLTPISEYEFNSIVAAINTPNPEQLTELRVSEIDQRLAEIDQCSVRPLRAKVAGVDTQADRDKLVALEVEAADLRAERSILNGGD